MDLGWLETLAFYKDTTSDIFQPCAMTHTGLLYNDFEHNPSFFFSLLFNKSLLYSEDQSHIDALLKPRKRNLSSSGAMPDEPKEKPEERWALCEVSSLL